MKYYNKLVRDKIPNIIEDSGKSCKYVKANKADIFELLVKKLDEEVAEFKEDNNLEELSDIMEVLFGLAGSLGFSEEDLVNKRNEKNAARGGFKDGIILEAVEE